MRIVRRYSNRRLYDTQASRTITQFDLARMIRDGHRVKVVDAASGKDITVEVLGRVMVTETARHGSLSEAAEFLRDLIITGGDKSMSILRNTVLASIGALHVTRAKAEKIIDDLIKKGELDKSDRKKAVMELLAKAEKTTAELRQKLAREADRAHKGVSKLASGLGGVVREDIQKLDSKLTRLARRVKALEDKMAQ